MIEQLRHAWDELTAPGANFAVTTAEVRGIPMKVFASAPANMRVIWELVSAVHQGDYLVYEDERHTYADVAAQVRALAHHLHADLGVREGDRVAIAMRNYPEWVVSYWAILAVGAAAVGMNAWWTAPEMAYALDDSGPRVLIADAERIERFTQIAERFPAMRVIAVRTEGPLPAQGSRWSDVVNTVDAPPALPQVSIGPDDDACIFYTSGTTGFPKGAQLTHRGCVTNLMHIGFWSTTAALAATRVDAGSLGAAAPKPAVRTIALAPTPLFHVTANNCILHPVTAQGGTVVLMYRWDPARALELIEREKITNFSGVPTMNRELLTHPDWTQRDTSSLTAMGGGGAAVQPDLVEKIDRTLTNGAPSTGYGLTETTGIITANGAACFLLKPASCGPVMPTFEAKLVDESGQPVAPGEPGVLCVRGPAVIKGYLNRDVADDMPDGWFNTGDVARIDDDGFVYIIDRIKDMVLRGGENVYCSEVEAALYSNDAVAEAAVFGIPDERLGEDVAAAIVLRPGSSLTAPEIQRYLTERIARHKVPSRVWILEEPLPRNATGKFVKRELRDRLLSADSKS